jgi:peptide/nickel transport system permease protein
MDDAVRVPHAVNARLWLAGGWLALALAAAVMAPWIAPHNPLEQDLMLERMPPF